MLEKKKMLSTFAMSTSASVISVTKDVNMYTQSMFE